MVFMHLAHVFLLSFWGHEGWSFWTCIGCFREFRGGWMGLLLFSCLESMTGSTFKRISEFNITSQKFNAALSQLQITTVN